MRVLAIDTALAACSAAVLDTASGGIIGGESLPMLRGHAEALMPLIARIMERARLAFADLDRVAVTTGPGSFTGLRVGISAARGIGLAADKPVFGVTTLFAYAAPHLAEDDTVRVIAAIEARRGQVYLQVFGPGGRGGLNARLVPLSEAVQAAGAAPAGSAPAGSAPCRLVGSAARSIVEQLPPGTTAPLRVDPRDAPNIDWVARMGAVLPEGQSPPKPQYLRAPDAQPQNAAQLPRR
ncbi:MAG: tRNA (adenosine(37)-N6)-threonylcarbamoyltransferase complex dimerization subunit type 1 TsaB [Xanthobacteraceae bacterium]